MVGEPVELVVDGIDGLVDVAEAEERTLLAGRGGLVILVIEVESVPFGRSGHLHGGIALTHEDAVVARQVVIADQDDAAPVLVLADRSGRLIGKADFGPGGSLHRTAQHAVEFDPLLADLDLGLPGAFGFEHRIPRGRFVQPMCQCHLECRIVVVAAIDALGVDHTAHLIDRYGVHRRLAWPANCTSSRTFAERR